VRIEVRYFASLAQRTGKARESYEVAPGADVAALWREIVARHPSLGELPYRPLVACDMEYAGWDRALSDVGEVAFLPPVSGG
jgi:molybdopterin synthase sulfur carrier subunit